MMDKKKITSDESKYWIKKKFLWFTYHKRLFEDRGKVMKRYYFDEKLREDIIQQSICKLCNTIARVGIKDEKSFLYCNVCRKVCL